MGLSVVDVSKTFSENSVRACDHVSFDVETGTVHALLGENGAGKTTLVKIVAGLLDADSGTVSLNGTLLDTARSALSQGVALVQQHPPHSPDLYLWEHACLGLERAGFALPLSKTAMMKELEGLAAEWGWKLPWRRTCRQVGSVVLQKASLLAFLRHRLKVLILDEPTSSLPENEAMNLLARIRLIAREKKIAVIFITHKLSEALGSTDRISVMRSGRIIQTKEPGETSVDELRTSLFPAELFQASTPDGNSELNESLKPILSVTNLTLARERRLLLQDVSFSVKRGEILGLTGLRDEGIEALEEVLSGSEEPTAGTIVLNEMDVTGEAIDTLRKLGMAYVPSDRLGRGSSIQTSLAGNVIPYRLRELSPKGLLRRRTIGTFFQSLKERFGLAGSPTQRLSTLSGGNIQKLILARELERSPCVLLLAEPTWGLDLSARTELYRLLRQAAAHAAGVIVLTSEIQEMRGLCSTIGVFRGGKLQAMKAVADWTIEELSRELLGVET